jgi:hypothetical protein
MTVSRLPKNYAEKSEGSQANTDRFSYDEEESYYIFRKRGCFPVSRSLALFLLVEPYDKIVQLEDSRIIASLFYLIYLPFGLLVYLVAELGFVFWFDFCCQQVMIPYEKVGIYGRGKHFALWSPEDIHDRNEMSQGRRKKKPTTTCLPIYNSCLETDFVEDANQQHHPTSTAPQPQEIPDQPWGR